MNEFSEMFQETPTANSRTHFTPNYKALRLKVVKWRIAADEI
jgi:hypothetical protein